MQLAIMVRKPSETEIQQLQACPVWSCQPSEFHWFYSDTETCLITRGKARLSYEGGAVEISPGDLVTLPKGLSCVWSVQEAISKHYRFE